MRVVRDHFAHIDRDGQRLHTKVRIQQDDTDRVAVFLNPNQPPQHVYSAHEVVVTRTSANCSHPVCYGKASRSKLERLWRSQEPAHV